MIHYKGEKTFIMSAYDVVNHCVKGDAFVYSFIGHCRNLLGNSYLKNNRKIELHSLHWSIIGTAHIIENPIPYITTLGCIDTKDFYLLNIIHVSYSDRFCIAPKTILGYWLYNEFMNIMSDITP